MSHQHKLCQHLVVEVNLNAVEWKAEVGVIRVTRREIHRKHVRDRASGTSYPSLIAAGPECAQLLEVGAAERDEFVQEAAAVLAGSAAGEEQRGVVLGTNRRIVQKHVLKSLRRGYPRPIPNGEDAQVLKARARLHDGLVFLRMTEA